MDPDGEPQSSSLHRLRVGGGGGEGGGRGGRVGGGGEGDGDLTSVCFDGDALLFRSYVMSRASEWSLKDEHFLKEVDVSGCRIWDGGAKVLSEDLMGSVGTLEDMDLSDDGIGDLGMGVLMPLLVQCSRLERLDLSGNCFSDAEGDMVRSLMRLPSLTSLNLSRNPSFFGMWALEPSSTLRELSLCGQEGGQALIENESAVLLSNQIHGNDSLEHLDLECNDIGDSGATALSGLLLPGRANRLRRLGLRNNLVGTPGAISIARALSHNASLVDIDLRKNAIGGEGIREVLCSVSSNTKIESILLGDNVRRGHNNCSVPSEAKWPAGLTTCLSSCASLVILDLSFCGVDHAQVLQLIPYITSDPLPPLRVLHLAGNPWSDESYLEIAAALRSNTLLRVLSLPPTSNRTCLSALGSALQSAPRPRGFMLMGVGLGLAAAELGLPSSAVSWDTEEVIEWIHDCHQAMILAFAMGLHPRLGCDSGVSSLAAAEDVMGGVSRGFWGPSMGAVKDETGPVWMTVDGEFRET